MNLAKFNLSHKIQDCLSRLLLVALLLFMGCNSSEVSHRPHSGSPFHPSTNLQMLSDSDILDDYDYIQMVIYNQEEDIEMLLSGKAGLSTSLTLNREKYQNWMIIVNNTPIKKYDPIIPSSSHDVRGQYYLAGQPLSYPASKFVFQSPDTFSTYAERDGQFFRLDVKIDN